MVRHIALGLCLLAGSQLASADEAPAAAAATGAKDAKAAIGQPAPNFTATGIDGKKFQLSDKLKSGRKNVVLIFSRANW